jgi:hypothetical protein
MGQIYMLGNNKMKNEDTNKGTTMANETYNLE